MRPRQAASPTVGGDRDGAGVPGGCASPGSGGYASPPQSRQVFPGRCLSRKKGGDPPSLPRTVPGLFVRPVDIFGIGLDVDDRCSVEGIEPPDGKHTAVDGNEVDEGEGDRVWTVG